MTREDALKVIRGEIDLCEEESVDALELEDVYSLVEHSIPLDRIKEARQEMTAIIEHCLLSGASIKACGLREARDIIDNLIAEVEGTK